MAHECLCESCCATPEPTYTEAYRFECEVKFVMAFPKPSWRRRYLDLALKARGKAAVDLLVEELVKRGALE